MSDNRPYSIERELAAALVRGGLSRNDFCNLTREEWAAVVAEIHERETAIIRGEWERTRQVVYATLSPHLRERVCITTLMPLPWDDETDKAAPSEPPTEEEVTELLTLYCPDHEQQSN